MSTDLHNHQSTGAEHWRSATGVVVGPPVGDTTRAKVRRLGGKLAIEKDLRGSKHLNTFALNRVPSGGVVKAELRRRR